MKRSIIILCLAVWSLGTITACSNGDKAAKSHQKKSKYTCTMHPNLSFDKPGVCSKCGMDLVERDTTEEK